MGQPCADHATDGGKELVRISGFLHVLRGAELEAARRLEVFIRRAKDDDRRGVMGRQAAHLREELGGIEPGKMEVGDNEGRARRVRERGRVAQKRQGVFAVGNYRQVNLLSALGECLLHKIDRRSVILNQKNVLRF